MHDDAYAGHVTTVQRDADRFAVVDADRLLSTLIELRPARATVTAEGGGWSAVLPGLPVHGDRSTVEQAVDDLLEALRDYADDRNARLLDAPHHRRHWPVVELVQLATDDQLREWLLAPEQPCP